MTTAASFYRRPLPDGHVAFSSDEGRRLFRDALDAGTMESFFALSEQFHTQAEPAYCGLGSLVMALNALAIDPGRLWKGPWRWFDETLLDCCVPLEQVRTRGVTLGELGCLAACNGARAKVVRAAESTIDELREAVLRAARSRDVVLVASYDRGALAQTGQGHFSPIGGAHAPRDLALLLDVARFKYPPHWVRIEQLFEAMRPVDPTTNRSRGWLELSAEPRPRPILLQLGLPVRGWAPVLERVADEARDDRGSVEAWTVALAQRVPELGEIVGTIAHALGGELAPEHRTLVDELLAQVRTTRPFRAIAGLPLWAGAPALAPEALAVLAHALAPEALHLDETSPPLRDEVEALRAQLAALGCSVRACNPAPGASP